MKVLYVIPGEENGSSMIFAKRQIHFLSTQNINTSSFYLRSRSNPIIYFREISRFRKLIRLFKPDIVHCHYGTATAFFAAFTHSKPLVITYHGSDLNFLKTENRVKEVIRKLLSQVAALRASAIICVSEKLKKKLWWKKKIASVLPMGIDENFFKPLPKDEAKKQLGISTEEKIILFNYGGAAVKRPDVAEAAFAWIKKKFPQSQLWMLEGSTSPEEMVLLLNAADCLLLCSDSEGSPTIIKEAMACNLPIVSTDVGDVRKNIGHTFPHVITDQHPVHLSHGMEWILKLGKRSDGREVLLRLGLTEQSISGNVRMVYQNVLKKI